MRCSHALLERESLLQLRFTFALLQVQCVLVCALEQKLQLRLPLITLQVLNAYSWVESANAFSSQLYDAGLVGVYGAAPPNQAGERNAKHTICHRYFPYIVSVQ